MHRLGYMHGPICYCVHFWRWKLYFRWYQHDFIFIHFGVEVFIHQNWTSPSFYVKIFPGRTLHPLSTGTGIGQTRSLIHVQNDPLSVKAWWSWLSYMKWEVNLASESRIRFISSLTPLKHLLTEKPNLHFCYYASWLLVVVIALA